MSEHEWKPGDRAMVIIERRISSHILALKGKSGISSDLWDGALYPLPMLDPITDLERAVVEAAINQMEAQPEHSTIPFRAAVNALRARRPPKPIDPEKELFDAHCAVMMAFAKPKTLPGVAQTRIAAMEMWRVALESMRKVKS